MTSTVPTDNTTLSGTSNTDQDEDSLDSGAVSAIVISSLVVVVAVVIISWYMLRQKQQRQVTLTMRRTQRMKRLNALHIDVEYSDTVLDSPTADRLSAGYTNLCSDISLEQDLQTEKTGSSLDFEDHIPIGNSQDNIADVDFCASLNEIKDSDATISGSFTDIHASEKCFNEAEKSDTCAEITPVPPVRFDFDTHSTNSSEIEMTIAALRNEEMTIEHLRSKDENNTDVTMDFSVCENNGDRVGIDGSKLANDRESLIERKNVASFSNQGLEMTE